jgi:hypothetical protein
MRSNPLCSSPWKSTPEDCALRTIGDPEDLAAEDAGVVELVEQGAQRIEDDHLRPDLADRVGDLADDAGEVEAARLLDQRPVHRGVE